MTSMHFKVDNRQTFLQCYMCGEVFPIRTIYPYSMASNVRMDAEHATGISYSTTTVTNGALETVYHTSVDLCPKCMGLVHETLTNLKFGKAGEAYDT